MDVHQTAKMIEWLDEQRLQDRRMIVQLQERLVAQQDVIEALTRRLNTMDSDQTMLKTQVDSSRKGAGGDTLDMVRREVQGMIEQQEVKRLAAEREQDKRSELIRDSVMRPVRELTDRLASIETVLNEIPGFQIERERTGEAVASVQARIDDLYKKVDEPERRLAMIEEQRRQDNRRLSESLVELTEIQKQVDTLRPKLALIEELTLRNERKVNETQAQESQRREQMQQFLDQTMLMLQQRDIQVQALTERFGEQDGAMQRNLERFEQWSETYRTMKRVVEDFERIGERLERRINEVGEMQRLSEERFRQEWNDWRGEDQKRFRQFTLTNDDVWRVHDREFEKYVQHMTEVEAMIPPLRESLQRIWQLERARAELYRERYQSLLHEFDTSSTMSSSSTGTIPAVRNTTTGTYPAVNGGLRGTNAEE